MFFCFHRCVCYTSLFWKGNLWFERTTFVKLFSHSILVKTLNPNLWHHQYKSVSLCFLLTSWPDTCYPGVGVSATEGPALHSGAGVRQWPQSLRVPISAPLSPAIGDTLPHGAPGMSPVSPDCCFPHIIHNLFHVTTLITVITVHRMADPPGLLLCPLITNVRVPSGSEAT